MTIKLRYTPALAATVIAAALLYSVSSVYAQELRQKDIVVHSIRIFDAEAASLTQSAGPMELTSGPSAREAIRAILIRQSPFQESAVYGSYYRAIRKRICEELEERYESSSKEGDINLIFTLNASGTLDSVDIDNASDGIDPYLCQIAKTSVRDASPFPPFPKVLALPQMAFTVTVSFRRQ